MKRLFLALMLTVPVMAQGHGEQQGAGGDHGGGHESIAMWKWANFAILAAILGWAISKNAGPFFASRNAEIRKSIDEARKVRDAAEARARDIEQRIGNLSAEVGALRDSSKREMEAEAARLRDDGARMMAKIEENTRREIESMTKQAEHELKDHAARLALELAEQKIKAGLTPGTQDALVNNFISNLRRTSNN